MGGTLRRRRHGRRRASSPNENGDTPRTVEGRLRAPLYHAVAFRGENAQHASLCDAAHQHYAHRVPALLRAVPATRIVTYWHLRQAAFHDDSHSSLPPQRHLLAAFLCHVNVRGLSLSYCRANLALRIETAKHHFRRTARLCLHFFARDTMFMNSARYARVRVAIGGREGGHRISSTASWNILRQAFVAYALLLRCDTTSAACIWPRLYTMPNIAHAFNV